MAELHDVSPFLLPAAEASPLGASTERGPVDGPPVIESLSLDELRSRVRELYDAHRAVDRERQALHEARQMLEAERRAFLEQHEGALRRSEQRLRTIFETEPECVKVISAEGDLLEINEAGLAMFDAASVAELKSHSLRALIEPGYRDAFAAMHARVLKGETGVLEFEMRSLRGRRRWVETHATSMLDEESQQRVVLSICRDVTAQKQSVKALLRNQTIVRQISNTLPLGFLVIDDRTARVLHVNQQFCDLFHISDQLDAIRSGAISGKEMMQRCGEIMLDPELIAASCIELGEPENRRVVEDEIRCIDDRTIRRFSTQIRDEADRYVGRFYLFEDISERRREEVERARLEGQLHQAMKMQSVGRLAGGVAHDFNNMLGVIIGHSEIAMRAVSDRDPVHGDLTAIHRAAERSAALTRQLLAFASKQTVAPKHLDLNDVVRSAFDMLQRLISEDICLQLQPQPDLWPVRIDPSQVDQILTNLCVNARDAIANVGTITITTTNCTVRSGDGTKSPDARPGDFVRLSVRDDGCGMAADVVAQIFEPFFTTKRLGMGTGLGLATVYGTVKQSDGFIAVDSAPQRGTTFEIYLPRATNGDDIAPAAHTSAPVERGRETVLVVEDEPAILLLVSHILQAQGYSVLRANSPQEAVDTAARHPGGIALLLTDVIMPEMNGRDLAALLQKSNPGIRALFMSGYTSDVIARHGVLADGVSFLQKPFSIDALATKVRETLDRRSS
jgi:PAS domain S-box-containing protein